MTTHTTDELLRENEELRRRLEEVEAAIRALHAGEADAVLVENGCEQVYMLQSVEKPYQLLVAQVPHPAASLTAEGVIIACNPRFADLLGRPLGSLQGQSVRELAAPDSHSFLQELLRAGQAGEVQGEITLLRGDGTPVPAHLGIGALREGALGSCLMLTDLTERRHYEELQRTQNALRESEERYRSLFESIDEGFCVVQMLFDEAGRPIDYRFLETNPAFKQQTGISEALGKTIRQLAPAHEEHWFQIYGQVAETGQPIRFQGRAEALQRWYDVYAFRAGEPRDRKVAILFNDITDRKRTEQALRESQARLASDLAAAQRLQAISTRLIQEGDVGQLYDHILEAAMDIMHSDMASMQIVDKREDALRMLAWRGFEPAFAQIFELVGPDTRTSCSLARRTGQRVVVPNVEECDFIAGTPALEDHLKTGIRAAQSTPLVSRDGRLLGMITTHWHAPHVPDERDLHLLDVLARQAADLIDRKESEKAVGRLAAIVDSSDDAIISKDLNGVITSWNKSAERLFGYRADEAIGQPVTLLIPNDRLDEETLILSRIRRGESVEHYDTVRVRKDGRRLDISLTISPIRDVSGRIIGASKIARDIADRKQIEETLRAADQRKDEFLATLAHELRGPLAPIRNAFQILKTKGPSTPELDSARGVIYRQMHVMTRLLDDLLDVSRISRNKLELRTERIELAAVIQTALETSQPVIEAAGHSLTVDLPPEPVHLDADPVRLAQVFANLLTNAAKYTENGGQIALTAQQRGSELVVSVKDNGIGILPEMLPKVFAIFAQSPRSLDRAQGGLGIGLSLVKGLVELHDGSITAHSEGPGRGSEFIVRLPLSETPGARMERPSTPTGTEPPATLAKRRILVVDDNEDSADTLTQLLEIMGHEVKTGYDGEQAVALAESMRPDLVLLDIGMPKLNGYDACRCIRKQPWGQEMVLVALTGWGQEQDRRRTEEAGFHHHIVKPVDPAMLTKLLASLSARPAEGA